MMETAQLLRYAIEMESQQCNKVNPARYVGKQEKKRNTQLECSLKKKTVVLK